MRLVVACGLALALALPARAQSRPDAPLAPARFDASVLDAAHRRAKNRRNIGIGLAVPGVALLILSTTLIVHGANNTNLFGAGEEIGAGTAAGTVGLALSIPGVVLWITGQDDMDVAIWRRRQLLESGALKF